jgi:uncharacterized membrane protein
MSDILVWYLWTQAFAFSGWIVASAWLRRLPDRGYGISKALGVILGGFAYWMVVTLGLSGNEPGAILLALSLVVLTGLGMHYLRKRQMSVSGQETGRLHLSLVIATEAVFALAFVACAVYRAYNPDIVEAGGEKFMESMMLNAILRSPTFPPNDAWLSGFTISYYYFGYVILAMITKISGIAPGVAFNLGGAMIFALTLTSAFSVGYNLWGLRHNQNADPQTLYSGVGTGTGTENSYGPRRHERAALMAGLLTALMLGVMGNLGGFMESVRCASVLPQSFWTWLDVRQIDTKPIECKGFLPTRFYWWWDWSRVIHDYTPSGEDQEVITETPAFSFILGDNHPHVMSLPFVLLAVALAMKQLGEEHSRHNDEYSSQITEHGTVVAEAVAAGQAMAEVEQPHDDETPGMQYGVRATPVAPPAALPSPRFTFDGQPVARWLTLHAADVLLTAIVVGGLSFMNTWDFPVYGALVVGAILLGRWHRREALLPGLVFGALIFVLGYLFYLPFYVNFSSQARGIGVNLFNGTRFVQFFLMFAAFIVAAPLFIWHVARERRLAAGCLVKRSLGLTVVGILVAIAGVAVFGLLSAQGRAYAAELATTGTVMGVSRATVQQRLLERLTSPWVPLSLLLTAAFCAVLILGRPSLPLASQPRTLTTSFVLLLFLGGALLTAAVEFIFLQDLFGTRMNTVFKFYYQGWTVWAIASAFALMTFVDTRGLVAAVGTFIVGGLLLLGLLFPIYAAISKTDFFSAKPTLDGSAYLQRSKPDDARIIDWLNKNVSGDPVIVEAPAERFGAYSYNGRISAFTGLPTLLGWGGHEHQWRGNYDEPARREPLINNLYDTTDTADAQRILLANNVRYVIVGDVERSKYSPEGLGKFEQMCSVAFRSGDGVVYQCQ